MHHTHYCKRVVSCCHDQQKEISDNLVHLMAHHKDTAQKYYQVFERNKSSVQASRKLFGIMRINAEQQAQEGTEDSKGDL